MGKQFQLGNPGGPGRPKGSRNRLAEAFLEALYQDFQINGVAAIADARTESPLGYVRLVAALLPQKLELRPSQVELTDAELLAIIHGYDDPEAARGKALTACPSLLTPAREDAFQV